MLVVFWPGKATTQFYFRNQEFCRFCLVLLRSPNCDFKVVGNNISL